MHESERYVMRQIEDYVTKHSFHQDMVSTKDMMDVMRKIQDYVTKHGFHQDMVSAKI